MLTRGIYLISWRYYKYYSLRPEKVDFVRMAGMFDAIIVPFSSVGIAESVNIFFDKEGGSDV